MPPLNELSARCPNPKCRHELWTFRRGQWCLENRIVRVVDGGIVARCPECRGDVPVPFFALQQPEIPVPAPAPNGVVLVMRLS